MSDPTYEHVLLTEHTPSPETHHMECGAPWMTVHTAHEDGTETTATVCPICG